MGDNQTEEKEEHKAAAELEELRRAIPQSEGNSTMSEVTVIANANSYIDQLKTQVEELKLKNQQLKEGASGSASETSDDKSQ